MLETGFRVFSHVGVRTVSSDVTEEKKNINILFFILLIIHRSQEKFQVIWPARMQTDKYCIRYRCRTVSGMETHEFCPWLCFSSVGSPWGRDLIPLWPFIFSYFFSEHLIFRQFILWEKNCLLIYGYTALNTSDFSLEFQGVPPQLVNNNGTQPQYKGNAHWLWGDCVWRKKDDCFQVSNLGVGQDVFLGCSHIRFRTIMQVSALHIIFKINTGC